MLADLLDLIFPRECLACEGGLSETERHLCLECLATLPGIAGGEHALANESALKLAGRLPLQVGTAMWNFVEGGSVQQLIHRLKYGDQEAACRYVGRLLGHHLAELGMDHPIDAITFVPMHPRKERKRGYNQALLLAEGLAAVLQLPVLDLVRKTTYTQSQTRLSRRHRWANLEGVFAANADGQAKTGLAGKHLLIVDDVLTTGATLERAAQPLLEAGAAYVSFAVVANAQ